MKNFKKTVNKYMIYIPILLVMGLAFTDFAFAGNKFADAWNELMKEYNVIVAGVAGFGLLSSFLIFIIHMFQLATLGSAHPMIRRKILQNILISGVTTALLGGVGLIYVLIYQTAFFG